MESDRNILVGWIEQWIRHPPPRNPIPYPVPKNLKWLCQERVLRGYPPCRHRRAFPANYHRGKRREVGKVAVNLEFSILQLELIRASEMRPVFLT